eukprot:Hpha_TRINITY_DN11048_c0_g1::TRINITY_DN11048_c0_g1_i1::g.93008::m.93008
MYAVSTVSLLFLVTLKGSEAANSTADEALGVGNQTGTCCYLCVDGCGDCAGCWTADYYCSQDRSSCLSLCRGRWCEPKPSTVPIPPPVRNPILPGAVALLKQSQPSAIGTNLTQVAGPAVGGGWAVWAVCWGNGSLVIYGVSLVDNSQWETHAPGFTVKALVEPQLTDGFVHLQVGAEHPFPIYGNASCYANPYDYPNTLQSVIITVDIRTGALRWSCRVGLYGTVSVLAPGADGVFYSTSNAKVFGVEPADGTGLWRIPGDTSSHPYSSQPSLAFGTVFQVGSHRGTKTLYAYAADSGQFVWEIGLVGSPNWQIPAVSSVGFGFRSATFFNKYEMSEPDGRIEAYQGVPGSAWIGPRWELNIAEVLGAPQTYDGLLYFTSCASYPDETPPSQTFREMWVNCSVWAVDAADASTGPVRQAVRWKYSLPPERAASDPVPRTGVVFLATTAHNGTSFDESFLVALDAASGDLLWEQRFPCSTAASGPNIAPSLPRKLAPWQQFDVSSDGTRLCHMGPGGVVTILDVSARVYDHSGVTEWWQRPGVIAVIALGTVLVCLAVFALHSSATHQDPRAQPLLPEEETVTGSGKSEVNPSSEGRPSTPSACNKCGVSVEEQHGYSVQRRLGRGGFGSVFLAERLRDGAVFSLKRLECRTEQELRIARNEVAVMRRLPEHPGLVQVVESFIASGEHNSAGTVYIVLPYFPEGDLANFVQGFSGTTIPESLITSFVMQLCQALSFLHALDPPVVHRDLKPANVLMSEEGTRVTLADFGLARLVDKSYMQTHAGTMAFMAPESFDGPYDAKVDLWSLGCVIYSLALRRVKNCRVLCVHVGQLNFHSQIASEVLSRGYSELIVQILRQLLQPSRHARPSAEELLFRLSGDAPATLSLSSGTVNGSPQLTPGPPPPPAVVSPTGFVMIGRNSFAKGAGEHGNDLLAGSKESDESFLLPRSVPAGVPPAAPSSDRIPSKSHGSKDKESDDDLFLLPQYGPAIPATPASPLPHRPTTVSKPVAAVGSRDSDDDSFLLPGSASQGPGALDQIMSGGVPTTSIQAPGLRAAPPPSAMHYMAAHTSKLSPPASRS